MGCIPSMLAQSPTGTFNANVKTMINNLSANLPGSRFTYVDIAHMFSDIATNARSYGTLFCSNPATMIIYIYIYI